MRPTPRPTKEDHAAREKAIRTQMKAENLAVDRMLALREIDRDENCLAMEDSIRKWEREGWPGHLIVRTPNDDLAFDVDVAEAVNEAHNSGTHKPWQFPLPSFSVRLREDVPMYRPVAVVFGGSLQTPPEAEGRRAFQAQGPRAYRFLMPQNKSGEVMPHAGDLVLDPEHFQVHGLHVEMLDLLKPRPADTPAPEPVDENNETATSPTTAP